MKSGNQFQWSYDHSTSFFLMHLPFPRCWRFLTPDIPKVCNAPPDRHHWNIFHGTERRKRTTFFVSFLGYSPLQCILGSKTMSIEWFAVWASNIFFPMSSFSNVTLLNQFIVQANSHFLANHFSYWCGSWKRIPWHLILF